MRETPSNKFDCFLALGIVVCILIGIRHAALATATFFGGAYDSTIGFLLVLGCAVLSIAILTMLWTHSGLSERFLRFGADRAVPLTWILYAIIALPVLFFTVPEGFDEARHIHYGMFLRGYDIAPEMIPALVPRSPLTTFLTALTYPFTQFINPLLLAALVVLILRWCRKYAHPAMAIFILILFIANDHFMQAIWAVMGELPGALLLCASFYLIAQGRYQLAALSIALAVLARWNLAPFAFIAVLFVAMRVSILQALIMTAIGAAIFIVWLLQGWILVGSPIDLLRGYAAAAHESTDTGGALAGVRPTTLGRLLFYSMSSFFQTLPALVAIPLSFFIPRSHHSPRVAEWFRYWIPASLLVYFLCIVLTGGYYPRLAVVVFPLSLLLLAEVIWSARHWTGLQPHIILPIMLILLPIGAATSVERYEVATMIGRKILVPPPLPASVAQAIREHTIKRDRIVMPQFYKVTRQSEGRHLRVYLRRNVLFFPDTTNPSHDLMFSRSLEDEIRDFSPRVPLFLESVPEGAYFLLPAQYHDQIDPSTVVIEKDGWILGHFPPVSDP